MKEKRQQCARSRSLSLRGKKKRKEKEERLLRWNSHPTSLLCFHSIFRNGFLRFHWPGFNANLSLSGPLSCIGFQVIHLSSSKPSNSPFIFHWQPSNSPFIFSQIAISTSSISNNRLFLLKWTLGHVLKNIVCFLFFTMPAYYWCGKQVARIP